VPQVVAQTNGRETTHGRQTIRAIRVESQLVVDGNLDEPAWNEAMVASNFVQKDPNEGAPATEKTEFRVLYTPTTLYVGVICYDSNPGDIVASERLRDGNLGNDDNVGIVLDTFHDHRNSYLFRTNPLGTQLDALVTDEGNSTNENWDEQWAVASRVTETGWTAEFAIPFKSLRVPEEDGNTWGLDVEREIRRKNESAYWNGYRRGFVFASVSQAGHVTGISEIETGLRLRVKPYLLGGFSQTVRQRSVVPPGGDQFRTVTQDASDAGIEVMKWRVTPSLTADFTWNTDFAQTEVDNQEINLDRFPLFFPEKREFFQEGAGIFEFGIAENENRGAVTKLFHTRRIGLSPSRLPIPIVAGGRITGRLQGFTLGLLNVQTERFAPESIPASNYSVARIKRDVLGRSTIGAFFLNRDQGGTDDHNRVFGADANFVFYRYLNIGGFFGKSFYPRPPGDEGDNWSTAAVVRWESDTFNLETSWHSVDADFRDDLGFIPRKDRRDISPQLAIRPRIDGRYIRQLIFRYRIDYVMNSRNHLETRTGHSAFEIRFQDGGVFGWVPHTRFDTLYRNFNLREGVVVIPPGSYSWWNNALRYGLSPSRRISGQVINWAHHVGYYGGGTFDDININPRVRITDQLSTQISYGINKATFPESMCFVKDGDGCGFTDHLVNARVNFNVNNQWLTSTFIQYNNADNFVGFQFRLNYIYRPGDDFFLIYNEGRQAGGPQDGEKDRTIQAKLTYSFDY
jgi:hypothetical protein